MRNWDLVRVLRQDAQNTLKEIIKDGHSGSELIQWAKEKQK